MNCFSFNLKRFNSLSRRLANRKLQRALLNAVKKAGNVHELALFTPHQFFQSKCCLQTYPSCILNVPEIEKYSLKRAFSTRCHCTLGRSGRSINCAESARPKVLFPISCRLPLTSHSNTKKSFPKRK